MKHLKSVLQLLVCMVVSICLLRPLAAWAGASAHCYSYSNSDHCDMNTHCSVLRKTEDDYCKRLCFTGEYGCCSYHLKTQVWSNAGGPCPCAGTQAGYTVDITKDTFTPGSACFASGSTHPSECSVDTLEGSCR